MQLAWGLAWEAECLGPAAPCPSCMGTHGDKWGIDPDVVYKALPASMRGPIFVRPPLSTGLELDCVPYIARKHFSRRLCVYPL